MAVSRSRSPYTIIDEKLGKPELLQLVRRVGPRVGHKWSDIALMLGLSQPQIVSIERDTSLRGNAFLREAFVQWENRTTDAKNEEKPYKWSTILSILEDPLIDSKGTAMKIRDELLNGISDELDDDTDKQLTAVSLSIEPVSVISTGTLQEEDNSCGSNEDIDEQKSETSGTASEDTLTFLCGCGNCTIGEFLQGGIGCQKPGGSKAFPLLDTSKLSPDRQQEIISQLTEDTESIEDEFAYLVTEIGASFMEREIKLSKLKIYLSTLESVKARAPDDTSDGLLFNPILEKINKAQDITYLFSIMANFWSWFNYRLLETVVKRFGNKDEQGLVIEYLSKLHKFLQRYVFQMPSSIHNPKNLKGFTKLSVKVADTIRSTKATEVPLIIRSFARILEIDETALILTSIKEGCVELIFIVPEVLQNRFPLSEDCRNDLFRLEWRICMITCGDAEPEYIRSTECIHSTYAQPTPPQQTNDDQQSLVSAESGLGSLTTTVTKKSGESYDTELTSEVSSSHGEKQATTKRMSYKYCRGILDVCQVCLITTPEDDHEKLALDSCHNPDLHDGNYPIVCAAWDDEEEKPRLVQIRPLPQMAIVRGFSLCNQIWCRGEKCTYAHSKIEKIAWNYEINKLKRSGKCHSFPTQFPMLLNPPLFCPVSVMRPIPSCGVDPKQIVRFTYNRRGNHAEFNKWKTKFKERLQRTKLTDDLLEPKLSVDNYQDKFYSLLCFEEMEHINLLTEKCDGPYEFEFLPANELATLKCLPYETLEYVGVLKGMSGNQIAYATQSSEGVYFVEFEEDGDSKDICKAQILSCNFSKLEKHLYISLTKKDTKTLRSRIDSPMTVCNFEFEVKHGFFDTLHKAVVNIPVFVIRKIMPSNENQFPEICYEHEFYVQQEFFQLAHGAQMSALNVILSASHRAPPILVSGPFGAGKTRILARAAYELIIQSAKRKRCNKKTRILICAHHPASIHTYINDYFGRLTESELHNAKVVRITRGTFQKDSSYNSLYLNLSKFRKAVLEGQYLNERCLVIITTYMTSVQLLSIIKEDDWYFTHIFLDEAAQVREPEAIAPLSLAGKTTKIVVAGDSKQVGPALVVLGQPAHENGLGVSLLERLEKKYSEIGDCALQYYKSLSDNYRCNQKITNFLSKLFYSGKAQNKVSVPLHPRVKFPFVFYCCDVERFTRAPKEAAFEAEADAVIYQLNLYYGTPSQRKWDEVDDDRISIMTSNRNQVNLLRIKLKGRLKKVNVLPTYMIQGHEFESVFLSTSEPLKEDGRSQDPQKSLCNPHVFNTAISRAKSLVVAVGNPFMLLKIEETMGSRRRCWKEYLGNCLTHDKIYFPQKYNWRARAEILSRIMHALENTNQKPLMQNVAELSFPNSEPKKTQPQIQQQPPPPPIPVISTHSPKPMSYAAALKCGTGDKKPANPMIKASQHHKHSYHRTKNLVNTSPTGSDTEVKIDHEGRIELLEKFMKSLKY